MAVVERRTFAVETVGVGREDYSQSVEKSVEPQIRSWQQEYQHYQGIEVAAGATEMREIEITARTVVLIYDFYLSVRRNVLLHMNLEFLTAVGTWASLIEDSSYQTVEIHYKKGFRFFRKYRVTITNYGEEDVFCYFSAHGIVTPLNIYYGEIVA